MSMNEKVSTIGQPHAPRYLGFMHATVSSKFFVLKVKCATPASEQTELRHSHRFEIFPGENTHS